MYGLMVYDIGGRGQSEVSFGNTASIIESRTTGRIQPLHYGVNYNENPLEFTLVFGSMREMDRYELEEVSAWLTGHNNYRWLSIDQPDMDEMQFRCIVTKLTPIYHGWLPIAFEATIRCDCPYAYGYPFTETYSIGNSASNIIFKNLSTVNDYVKPTLMFTPNGATSISIVNHSDNDREFKIENISDGSVVLADNLNGILTDTSTYERNLYSGFNLNFFRLVRGDNALTITGKGVLKISGRFLYNAAG